ncbi:MAG: Na+/H+ antiporter NhaD [Micavibrio sp.]|nr:MAG: Na+/H+ antiporter NhaD [Micavibrio sp.]
MQYILSFLLIPILLTIFPSAAWASTGAESHPIIHVGMHPVGIFCIGVFVLSYIAVLLEEKVHLPKSKPVMFGASIIWVAIAIIAPSYDVDHGMLRDAVFTGLEEYASLLLFLLAAMTYISVLQERLVFETLRSKLVQSGFNLQQLFWITGILSFFLSPIADNLTTALVMGAVVISVGANNPKFVAIACINVVCAANAGGAFSPFGDITTLMVWQAGHVDFFGFFALFVPSVVCFLIPTTIMSFFIPKDNPLTVKEVVSMKHGAKFIIFLGLCTIAMAVGFEQFLGLPPFVGMMAGLSLLMITAWFIRHSGVKADKDFDVIEQVARSEWDTLLFFFGVIFSVGGLSFLGYMELASSTMYDGWGASVAHISLGLISAVIDNIPVMFAVLSMEPELDRFQWLLITLTTGVGGSLLSVGSAAGVALMGTARGQYTFFSHLKWTPVIALGYVAAIGTHFLING